MRRVSAYIVGQKDGVYEVVASLEGCEAKFTYSIQAASEDEAAMQAIRNTESVDSLITASARIN